MAERTRWSQARWFCWICGWHAGMRWPHPGGLPQLETHEMLRGPLRRVAVKEPCCWFRACSYCHSTILPGMPLADQLAYKLLCDLDHYDLSEVLKIRNARAMAFVTHDEVLRIAGELFRKNGWMSDVPECRVPDDDEQPSTW